MKSIKDIFIYEGIASQWHTPSEDSYVEEDERVANPSGADTERMLTKYGSLRGSLNFETKTVRIWDSMNLHFKNNTVAKFKNLELPKYFPFAIEMFKGKKEMFCDSMAAALNDSEFSKPEKSRFIKDLSVELKHLVPSVISTSELEEFVSRMIKDL